MICVVAFDPIKIQLCLSPQNDCQNLIFVKDNYAVREKMTRNGCKKPNLEFCFVFKCSDFIVMANITPYQITTYLVFRSRTITKL